MEIPTLRLELYRQNPKQFAQELDYALRTTRVAQVSGLEQQLVDDIFGYMQENVQNIRTLDTYLKNNFYLQIFNFSPAYSTTYIRRRGSKLNTFIKKIKKNLSEIAEAVTNASVSLYEPIKKPKQLILARYYKKQGLTFPGDKKRKEMIEAHKDAEVPFVITTPASAKGLECRVGNQWVHLEPEKGHVLVLAGKYLESISDLKPLYHRVVYPKTDRYALLYL